MEALGKKKKIKDVNWVWYFIVKASSQETETGGLSRVESQSGLLNERACLETVKL